MLAISTGAFLDESGYLMIGGKTHEDNYSPQSFVWIMLFEILLFVFRKSIVQFYNNIKQRNV